MKSSHLLAGCILIVGCSGDGFVTPVSSELFFYAALTPPGTAASDTALYAFLLEAGTPLAAPYVVADRFEMRRASDGALLDWRPIPPGKAAISLTGRLLNEYGNYVLPLRGVAGRLGRIDLASGDRFDLLVEVGGEVIRGSVTIPALPDGDFDGAGPLPVLRWNTVAGAGGYSVTSQDFLPTFAFTRDTVFHFDGPLSGNISGVGTIIRAYDPQLFSYLADQRIGRAGISEGLGVLGAYTSQPLPPR